jgi:hypothetical protein
MNLTALYFYPFQQNGNDSCLHGKKHPWSRLNGKSPESMNRFRFLLPYEINCNEKPVLQPFGGR